MWQLQKQEPPPASLGVQLSQGEAIAHLHRGERKVLEHIFLCSPEALYGDDSLKRKRLGEFEQVSRPVKESKTV